jgi:hypothetical protein
MSLIGGLTEKELKFFEDNGNVVANSLIKCEDMVSLSSNKDKRAEFD